MEILREMAASLAATRNPANDSVAETAFGICGRMLLNEADRIRAWRGGAAMTPEERAELHRQILERQQMQRVTGRCACGNELEDPRDDHCEECD